MSLLILFKYGMSLFIFLSLVLFFSHKGNDNLNKSRLTWTVWVKILPFKNYFPPLPRLVKPNNNKDNNKNNWQLLKAYLMQSRYCMMSFMSIVLILLSSFYVKKTSDGEVKFLAKVI